jgi:predicted ATPase
MTLRKISISGYKSISQADIELQALNVLIGANGAGKSNFVGVFELLREVVEGRLQSHVMRRGGADRLLRFGRKHTAALGIELLFDANVYHVALVPSDDGSLIFEFESYYAGGSEQEDPVVLHVARGGERESRMREAAERAPGELADQVFRMISGWRLYHFHDTTPSAKVKQTGDIGDNEALRADAANLAAYLYRLEKTARPSYELIMKTVQRVAPFFERFKLRPTPLHDSSIRLEWEERGSDALFDAQHLSDGTLRFICLATLLLQPELPSVILLDEPELGLHPHAIALLAGLLRRAAHHTQLVVATQSVTLLDQLAPDNLIVVEREPVGGASSFRRLPPSEVEGWLDGYSLGDLWEKNIFGGHPE